MRGTLRFRIKAGILNKTWGVYLLISLIAISSANIIAIEAVELEI